MSCISVNNNTPTCISVDSLIPECITVTTDRGECYGVENPPPVAYSVVHERDIFYEGERVEIQIDNYEATKYFYYIKTTGNGSTSFDSVNGILTWHLPTTIGTYFITFQAEDRNCNLVSIPTSSRVDTNPFIGLTVDIRLNAASTAEFHQFAPNFLADWGDGTVNNESYHTYVDGNPDDIRRIIIKHIDEEGVSVGMDYRFCTEVFGFGNIKLKSGRRMFDNCENTIFSFRDSPNLSNADISFESMFSNCKTFNSDISGWIVSNVTSLSSTFSNCDVFNSDISGWDVSSVTNMFGTFSNCDAFDSDISSWDVSGVTTMYYAFQHCYAFNSDISGWDVSSVTNMNYAFQYSAIYQNLSGWNVSSVTDSWEAFDSTAMQYYNGVYDEINNPDSLDWLPHFP